MIDQLIEKLSDEELGLGEFLEEEYIKNKSIPVSLIHRWEALYVLSCLDNKLVENTHSHQMRDILHAKLQWIEEGMPQYGMERSRNSQEAYRIHQMYTRESASGERSLISEAVFLASLGTAGCPSRLPYRSVRSAATAVAMRNAEELPSDLVEARGMLINLLDELQMSRQKVFQLIWIRGQRGGKIFSAWKDQTEDALYGVI